MTWQVKINNRTAKRLKKLPENVQLAAQLLTTELELSGPIAKDWPNYGKLSGKKGDLRHCHLIKSRPTYVACWEVLDSKKKLIEVYYAGTHENAPY